MSGRGRPAEPAWAMLAGGLVPAAVSGAAVAVAGVILSTRAGAGAAVGALLAIPALAVVPGLLRAGRSWPAEAALLAAVSAYATVIALLYWAYSLVSGLSWLDARAAGVGFGAATVAWSLGVMRAMRRLRQHLYDTPGRLPADAPRGTRDGWGSETGGPP